MNMTGIMLKEVLDNMHWKYSETVIDHAKNPETWAACPSDGFAQHVMNVAIP